MKLQEKITATKLRRAGWSFGNIRKKLGISKSTLSLWLRDVRLTPSQNSQMLKGREISREAAATKQKELRIKKTLATIRLGKREFSPLLKNQLFLPGLALYWAEGDKHIQERVKFTNSDPSMIAFMMRWFREICEVPEEKFRIALHIHTLHIEKNVERYWSGITGVAPKQFQKTYIKPTSLGVKRNVLYRGTCAIVVNNKNLFRRIVGWKEAFGEHFDIMPS